MKKKIIVGVLFTVLFNAAMYGQTKGKLQFAVEIPVKISVGKTSLQKFNYKGMINYYTPKIARYNNPIVGVDLNLMYGISNSFKVGIASGVNCENFETHPYFKYDYYNRVMFPVYGKFRYQKEICPKGFVMSDLNIGYLIADNRLDNDTDGFYFKSKGTLMAGMDLGGGYKVGSYWLYLKIGYEINMYNNTDRLDWGVMTNILTEDDKISYKTYYHTLRLSLGISL